MTTKLQELSEAVYQAAIAYKAAEEEDAGKWALAARWGEYCRALTDHADHVLKEMTK